MLVIIMNTDVQAFSEYSIGVPEYAFYKELISSDDAKYAGSGICNTRQVRAKKKPMIYTLEYHRELKQQD